MESMAITMTGFTAILYGWLAGTILGIIAAVLAQRKDVNKLRMASGGTFFAFAGFLVVRAIWFLLERAPDAGMNLSGAFWGWFLVVTLIVVAVWQWIVWLMAKMEAVQQKRIPLPPEHDPRIS
jgi:ABC-type dipeptide/oligopeptide/nickel transport system permease subunit